VAIVNKNKLHHVTFDLTFFLPGTIAYHRCINFLGDLNSTGKYIHVGKCMHMLVNVSGFNEGLLNELGSVLECISNVGASFHTAQIN
jgi:hypothetical protein